MVRNTGADVVPWFAIDTVPEFVTPVHVAGNVTGHVNPPDDDGNPHVAVTGGPYFRGSVATSCTVHVAAKSDVHVICTSP
jgi:hypothetical protein